MNIQDAENIYKETILLDEILVRIDHVVSEIYLDRDKEEWVNRLGKVFKSINEEIIIPILKEYPHLEGG